MSTKREVAAGVGGKYLTFVLGEEEYGVRIENVREIIAMLPVTRVPRTPEVVLGVINLRGKIVPVFDMHRKLGMPPVPDTRYTCIVVVTVEGMEVGIVVDRVREVMTILETQVEPSPTFGADVRTDHLLGIATTNGSARLLLAIDRVLSTSEVIAVGAPPSTAEQRV